MALLLEGELMGDTGDGSWDSRGLGGWMRREEGRRTHERTIMTPQEIRTWGRDLEHPKGPDALREGVRVATIQAQATLELAAQVAEFKDLIREYLELVVTSGHVNVQGRG